jgi:polyisoprenoid-binding protein YceI
LSLATARTIAPTHRRLLLPLAILPLAAVTLGGPVRAQDAATTAEPATSAVPEAGSGQTLPEGVDGTWSIDASIGDFADFSSAWVGFRVNEVLQNIGETQAVGRTPVVTGQLSVAGTTLESATIEADLTAIASDQSRRDPAIQDALETDAFPTATFVSSAPVDLGEAVLADEPFTASVPGTLTIHGVGQEATLEMVGQRVDDVVVVVGTLPVDFTSFGVTMPTAPIVVSVEGSGDLEWQLFFRRDA